MARIAVPGSPPAGARDAPPAPRNLALPDHPGQALFTALSQHDGGGRTEHAARAGQESPGLRR